MSKVLIRDEGPLAVAQVDGSRWREFTEVLVAEWTKFRTVRSTVWTLAAVAWTTLIVGISPGAGPTPAAGVNSSKCSKISSPDESNTMRD